MYFRRVVITAVHKIDCCLIHGRFTPENLCFVFNAVFEILILMLPAMALHVEQLHIPNLTLRRLFTRIWP